MTRDEGDWGWRIGLGRDAVRVPSDLSVPSYVHPWIVPSPSPTCAHLRSSVDQERLCLGCVHGDLRLERLDAVELLLAA